MEKRNLKKNRPQPPRSVKATLGLIGAALVLGAIGSFGLYRVFFFPPLGGYLWTVWRETGLVINLLGGAAVGMWMGVLLGRGWGGWLTGLWGLAAGVLFACGFHIRNIPEAVPVLILGPQAPLSFLDYRFPLAAVMLVGPWALGGWLGGRLTRRSRGVGIGLAVVLTALTVGGGWLFFQSERPPVTRSPSEMTGALWADGHVLTENKERLRNLFFASLPHPDPSRIGDLAPPQTPDDRLGYVAQALRIDPRNGWLYVLQAYALLEKRAWAEAGESVRKAVAQKEWYLYVTEKSPGLPDSHLALPRHLARAFLALSTPSTGQPYRAQHGAASGGVQRIELEPWEGIQALEGVVQMGPQIAASYPRTIPALLEGITVPAMVHDGLLELYEIQGLPEKVQALERWNRDFFAWQAKVRMDLQKQSSSPASQLTSRLLQQVCTARNWDRSQFDERRISRGERRALKRVGEAVAREEQERVTAKIGSFPRFPGDLGGGGVRDGKALLVTARAYRWAKRQDPGAFLILQNSAGHRDPAVRSLAVGGLRYYPSPEATATILQAARRDPQLRYEALFALQQQKTPAAAQGLRSFREDEDPDVRRWAEFLLKEGGGLKRPQ